MLVTVITACYNASRHIEDAFASLAAQTYPDIEHIVIDGGSKDGTVDIIKRHSGRISKWISEPDKGLADAWNKGLALAQGGIIGLLNADDLYEERAVEKAVAALQGSDWALAYGDASMFTADRAAPDYLFRGNFRPELMHYGFGFMHTTCFTTRRVYREIGNFDLRYRIAVDTDFLLRCHLKGVEFRNAGLITHMRSGGMSHRHRHAAYMEYLAQLWRHGYPKARIARAWASELRRSARERWRGAPDAP